MDKYLIFVDVDGTITPSSGREVSKAVIDEVNRLKSLGHKLIITTGRTLTCTLNVKGIECFDYFAVMFGCVIFDESDNSVKVLTKSMNKNDLQKFVQYLISNNYNWTYKDKLTDKSIVLDQTFLTNYNAKNVNENEMQQDIDNERIYQLLIETDNFDEKIIDSYPNFNFIKMPGNYYDVTVKGAQKSKAIDYFKKLYPNYKTISIGDSNNDIDMLTKTDISIAMGNASDEIKNITTFVTKSISEDGFVYAFKDLLKL